MRIGPTCMPARLGFRAASLLTRWLAGRLGDTTFELSKQKILGQVGAIVCKAALLFWPLPLAYVVIGDRTSC